MNARGCVLFTFVRIKLHFYEHTTPLEQDGAGWLSSDWTVVGEERDRAYVSGIWGAECTYRSHYVPS